MSLIGHIASQVSTYYIRTAEAGSTDSVDAFRLGLDGSTPVEVDAEKLENAPTSDSGNLLESTQARAAEFMQNFPDEAALAELEILDAALNS